MTTSTPIWDRDRHRDRRATLIARGRIKSAIRSWFEAEGFTEVDTAALQVSPGNETHVHAFRTEFATEAGATAPLYLHTSPEFAMKKLLAAGETKIFTFAPVFRNGEVGPLHMPEFTMLEWYRAETHYRTLMDDCDKLAKLAAEATGRWDWAWTDRGHPRVCDLRKPYEQTTLHEAFWRFCEIRLDQTVVDGRPDLIAMRTAADRIGVRTAPGDTWSDLFSRIMTEKIDLWLGHLRPQMLCEYPTIEAALARPVPGRSDVAERFEFYVCGVELANAFGELTDPAEQRRRFEHEMAEKQRLYGRRHPIDEDFLAALAAMPQASGAALGFDRLVMLATGAASVEAVQWTPVDLRLGGC